MDKQVAKPSRIVIIGMGAVGSTTAYTLLLRRRASELVFIDSNTEKAVGDALDMNHGMPFIGATKVWSGDYEDCAEADIVIIAAGAAQGPGETRQDLLSRNATIISGIVQNVVRYNHHGILLIATNPVDVLTYLAFMKSGWPPSRVIGSGTLLDSARFRYSIGGKLGVDARSVHVHIIGEHGDTELPVWSRANIAGVPVDIPEEDRNLIFTQTRDAAYQIIAAKGATNYAIALALDRICASILQDECSVLNVSALLQNYHGISDVYLGIPCVVDRSGICSMIDLVPTESELALLNHSADVLKKQIKIAMNATE